LGLFCWFSAGSPAHPPAGAAAPPSRAAAPRLDRALAQEASGG
jgi:hypothetical protein